MFSYKKKFIALLTAALTLSAPVSVGAAYTYEDAAQEFYETLEIIDTLYYYSDDIDYKEVLDEALETVFDQLDPYSAYLTLNEYNDYQQYGEPNKSGIGINMRNSGSGYARILKVYKGSPAEKAGLLKDDYIIKVGGEDILGKNLLQIRELLIGTTGTNVALTVLRNGETKEISATRGTFVAPLVEREKISDIMEGASDSKTAYVAITTFTHNEKNPQSDTAKQFLKIYEDLKKENIENLIIDLRGNSGGDVSALVEIAEVLVRPGVMFSFKYNTGKSDTFRARKIGAPEFDVAILVDQATASSSEILASAVKESNSGIIVGSNTFGKGVGQAPFPGVDGKHMILLTVTEIISRNGNKINGVGIEPDIYIEPPPWIIGETEINANSSEQAVASLKKALVFLGYDPGTGSGYDNGVQLAVKSLQKDLGTIENGICDTNLLIRLNDSLSDKELLNNTALKRAYAEINK